jgi:hypothetical protein
LQELIMEDHRLTIWEIADEFAISRGSPNMILSEDLGMRRVAAKFVPKLLFAGAAATPPRGRAGHAGVRQQGSSVPEDCDHW